jgi:putative thiamine transport system ATP-binding protein
MGRPVLELRDVRIFLGDTELLSLSATVAPGEALTVMGPSGAGKSSLLAFIAGFLGPEFTAKGRIFLAGRDITALPANERRLGLMFQDPLLFPHMSVGGNLMFALPPGGSRRARRERCEAHLDEVSLKGFFDRDPATLSGGQRTRAALARVLVSDPLALLLDEPFSALDQTLRAQIRTLVLTRAKAHGLPLVLVTHDPADAEAAGGMVIELDATAAAAAAAAPQRPQPPPSTLRAIFRRFVCPRRASAPR